MVTSRRLPGTAVEVEIVPESYPGEAEEIRRALRQFTDDHVELESRRAELTASAPEQWYAISASQTYTARELPHLLDILREAGIDPAFTALRFFSNRKMAHQHLV